MITPVKFELAKLLKEKGIKIDTNEVIFYRDEINNIEEHQIKNRDILYHYTGIDLIPTLDDNEYQTYTISEVVMWLYEKHGIWIQPFPYDTITAAKEWTATILSLEWGEDKEVHYEQKIGGCNSPTEAYEAAIEYTLKNLI